MVKLEPKLYISQVIIIQIWKCVRFFLSTLKNHLTLHCRTGLQDLEKNSMPICTDYFYMILHMLGFSAHFPHLTSIDVRVVSINPILLRIFKRHMLRSFAKNSSESNGDTVRTVYSLHWILAETYYTEVEFLEEIQTEVLRAFLLAIHRNLY